MNIHRDRNCDVCGFPLTIDQEFYGHCPRCGAGPSERFATRGTKIKLQSGVKRKDSGAIPHPISQARVENERTKGLGRWLA